MRFGKRRQEAPERDQPRGVRIHHADGRVSECSLARDPEDDPDGYAQWIVVPPHGTAIGLGDTLGVDYLPGRTAISLPMDLG